MNVLISDKWLKEYTPINKSPKQFAEELSLYGPSVERIIDWHQKLEKIFVAKVLKIKNHPNADRLKVVLVDLGGEKKEVVCGGVNLREDMLVAYAGIGAEVNWHGQGKLFKIEPAKIRGVQSEGMICAASELSIPIEEGAREIWDLSFLDIAPGTPLAQALTLDDYVYDIEITTNRSDWLGVLGIAREASAILGTKFLYQEKEFLAEINQGITLSVDLKNNKNCRVYNAIVLDNITVGPSPIWLQARLWQAGIRSINNIVDITNYVMLEYGQPLHAFDYDKIDQKIIIRSANQDESFKALDGQDYKLSSEDLVIADQQKVLALAGVIGGFDSAISKQTSKIVLESANFLPLSVRKTSRRHNIITQSSQYFEKNIAPQTAYYALQRAVELIREVAGGRVVSNLVQVGNLQEQSKSIFLPYEKVQGMIGVEIPKSKVIQYLSSLGFEISENQKGYQVITPYWRIWDIEGWHDLIEEISRMYGYHNLPAILPKGEIPEDSGNDILHWEEKAKKVLEGLGFIELYNYSFISQKDVHNLGLLEKDLLKIINPLNEDLVFMRPSLYPQMLKTIEINQNFKNQFALFELSNVYKSLGQDVLPEERRQLILAWTSNQDYLQTFLTLKGLLEVFFDKMGIKVNYKPLLESKYFRKNKCAIIEVMDQETVKNIGQIGIISRFFESSYGIKKKVAVAILDFVDLLKYFSNIVKYSPIPEYPSINLDFAIVLDNNIYWQDVKKVIESYGGELLKSVELFDVYKGDKLESNKKSLAFSLEFRREDRTLTMQEAQELSKKIIKGLNKKLGAVLRD